MPWSKFDQDYAAPTGGRTISYCAAVREAIDQAMVHDPRVFALGLDADDKFGVFGSMSDLSHPERVLGTPISENAMTGVALGAALCGLRPIHVHLRNDFLLVAMDQIVNYVAKWEHMFDRQVRVPLQRRQRVFQMQLRQLRRAPPFRPGPKLVRAPKRAPPAQCCMPP